MGPRRLLLIRHAQAADAPVDAQRPLTDRGARRGAAIGGWLADAGLVPDRVLVSPARRAGQTWERAAGRLPGAPHPVVDDRIYVNTVEALLAAVGETPDDVPVLAVVGHNPSIGELAAALDDGQGDPAARRDVGAGFPTGGVAVFTLGTPFSAVAPGAATLDGFAVPGG
jgi:phosphohistidine phosphatase